MPEKLMFFNSMTDPELNYDEITSKCFIFTLLEEFLSLKMMNLNEELRKKLEEVIETNWRENYIQEE